MQEKKEVKMTVSELKKSFETINFWHSVITFLVILGILGFFLYVGDDARNLKVKTAPEKGAPVQQVQEITQ